MKKEKKEWVTPEISKLCLENNEGKTEFDPDEFIPTFGPS